MLHIQSFVFVNHATRQHQKILSTFGKLYSIARFVNIHDVHDLILANLSLLCYYFKGHFALASLHAYSALSHIFLYGQVPHTNLLGVGAKSVSLFFSAVSMILARSFSILSASGVVLTFR